MGHVDRRSLNCAASATRPLLGWRRISTAVVALCIPFWAVAAKEPVGSGSRLDAGLHAEIVSAIYDSIAKIQDDKLSLRKLELLKSLAAAEAKRGDPEGARKALAEARLIGQSVQYAHLTAELAVSSYRAGDRAAGMEFIRRLPDKSQAEAFEKIAIAQIEDGDLSEAERTTGLILAMRAPVAPAPTPTDNASSPKDRPNYDYALSNVGLAFARKGDVGRASAIVPLVTTGGHRIGLLSAIASSQFRAGNQRGADETLQRLKADLAGSGISPTLRSEALALGLAGHLDKALELINGESQKAVRNQIASQLAQSLANDGQLVAALKVAEISGDPETLVRMGWTFKNAGKDPDARTVFLAAHDMLRRQNGFAPIDRTLRVVGIVDGLVAVGDFSNAISASKELDALNRPSAIVRILNAERKLDDIAALRETIPVALEIAETATAANGSALPSLAIALAEAGHVKEAKVALSKIIAHADQLSGWQRLDRLRAARGVQEIVNDREGIARTDQAIQAEVDGFNASLRQLVTQTDAQGNRTRDAEVAQAMLLYRQFEASKDEKAKEEIWQRLGPILTKHNVRLEAFVSIIARYEPQLLGSTNLGDLLKARKFGDAAKAIESMTGNQKDLGLRKLAQALGEAGDYKEAFAAARAISNPDSRASSLVAIIAPSDTKAR